MLLTETGVIAPAEVHVQLQVITEVQYRTDPMAIQRRRPVLIPIEEILVMRCVHLPLAEVIDPVPRDHQGLQEVLVTSGVPEVPEALAT